MNIAGIGLVVVILMQIALLTLAKVFSGQSLPDYVNLLLYFLQATVLLGLGLILCYLLYMSVLDLIKGNK